ncbi:MlaA family lipoprotein [Desulforegula conservatrix]|uniref:MlaA family lipoprotein n=1 Tax=Desulforegula conservatrix TaxID=153026 RepID=UPI000401C069|nr:VacJ family lipoprotein [Desulforegula conservatrix]
MITRTFKYISRLFLILAIVSVFFNATCSIAAEKNTTEEDQAFLYGEDNGVESDVSNDPIEFFNRPMFIFNDKMYFWLLKPVAQGYKFITPDFFRAGVRNFFRNFSTPGRFLGCVMQGKGKEAEAELARFLVNSTFGLAGLFDLTAHVKEMNPPAEDPGQALGSYGIGNGFYIVWPFLGPSTLRDTTGGLISYGVDPTVYLSEAPAGLFISMKGLDTINATSDRIGDYETIKEAAFDPYVMIRDGYIQRRNAQINQ